MGYSLLCQLSLDFRNGPGGIEPLRTGIGTVHDGMAAIEGKGII